MNGRFRVAVGAAEMTETGSVAAGPLLASCTANWGWNADRQVLDGYARKAVIRFDGNAPHPGRARFQRPFTPVDLMPVKGRNCAF
jgi:hypothetical protein